MFGRHKTQMATAETALAGRTDQTMPVPAAHFVLGTPLQPPWPAGYETAVFAMGCFWGAERRFWQTPGVHSTAVGYIGGFTPNPTYEEVCSGMTGHTEAVLVVFDPAKIAYEQLLKVFWESHDPTQGMRQGNDVGTQYRSGIYAASAAQREAAERSRDRFQAALDGNRFGPITTEIADAGPFFYAEPYHQQYLGKNPSGYCGLGGTGVSCPVGGSVGRVTPLGRLPIASLALAGVLVAAPSVKTVLTTLDEKRCTTLSTSAAGEGDFSTQRCPGTAGYSLLVSYDDARDDLSVVAPNGKETKLDLFRRVGTGFSTVGPTAEWRLENGRPVALTVRFVVANPDADGVKTSYLVVSKITAGAICPTDKVRPGPTQNADARSLAATARGRPCLRATA